jgi:hypothetical protein
MIAFAYYKIRPSEWYTMSLAEFIPMMKAYEDLLIEEEDSRNTGYAWIMSNLMNATGNYKKHIQAKDLYTSIHATPEEKSVKVKDKAYVEAETNKLLTMFADVIGEDEASVD